MRLRSKVRVRNGKDISDSAPTDTYANLAISPDGKYIVTDKTDTTNENTDVFIYDPTRASFRRLTFDPGIDAVPVWSPDGSRIAFTSSRGRNFGIYVKPADGSQPERQLALTSGSMRFLPTGHGMATICYTLRHPICRYIPPWRGNRTPF